MTDRDTVEEQPEHDCEWCDEPYGPTTRKYQVPMPINRKVQSIDHCIARIVASLNAGNVPTIASCCGHGKQKGLITLMDGRILTIEPPRKIESKEDWDAILGLPPA